MIIDKDQNGPMDFEEIDDYCRKYNVRICDNDFKSCPCKIIDFEGKTSFCKFVPMFGKLLIEDDSRKIQIFLEKVCPKFKNEVLHHDYRAKYLRSIGREFLARVKIGDVVFCTAEIHDVVFIAGPTHKYGLCRYKTSEGTVNEAPSYCFSIISKGNNYADFKTKDNYKADLYSRMARRRGFRIERNILKDTYILKIYGDSQEELDEFVTNLKNDLVLYDF